MYASLEVMEHHEGGISSDINRQMAWFQGHNATQDSKIRYVVDF